MQNLLDNYLPCLFMPQSDIFMHMKICQNGPLDKFMQFLKIWHDKNICVTYSMLVHVDIQYHTYD